MRDKFNLSLAITALLIWSVALIYFYASGRIEAYLAERFRIMALLAGLGLAVVAVFNMTRLFAKEASSNCGHDHGDGDGDHDHDHEDKTILGNSITFILMVAPLLVAASYSQDRYVSTQTILNKSGKTDVEWNAVEAAKAQAEAEAAQVGSSTAGQPGEASTTGAEADDKWEYTLDDLKKVVDTSEEGNLVLAVDQLFYTNGDAELQRVLEGQSIETIGQVIPELGHNPGDKRLRVFRLMVTCCAADAQPVSIPVEFSGDVPDLKEGDIKEMSWVKITGTMTYPTEEDRANAIIKVKSFEKTEEPMDYLMF